MKAPEWVTSIRAMAVLLTFGLVYMVVLRNLIAGSDLINLINFLIGLVIGGYFSKDPAIINPPTPDSVDGKVTTVTSTTSKPVGKE